MTDQYPKIPPQPPMMEPPPPYSNGPQPTTMPPPPGFVSGPYPQTYPQGIVYEATTVTHQPGPSITFGATPIFSVQNNGTNGGVTQTTVIVRQGFGPYPMQVTCTNCNANVMTETNASPGLLTWLLSGSLVLVGCWLGCCLIPCCIPECQDIEHRCPNCKCHIGTYRRL